MVCLRIPAETMRWRRRGAGLVLVEAILLGVVWLEGEEEEEEESMMLMVFLRMEPFLIMKIVPLLLGVDRGVVEAVFLLRGVVRVIVVFNGLRIVWDEKRVLTECCKRRKICCCSPKLFRWCLWVEWKAGEMCTGAR